MSGGDVKFEEHVALILHQNLFTHQRTCCRSSGSLLALPLSFVLYFCTTTTKSHPQQQAIPAFIHTIISFTTDCQIVCKPEHAYWPCFFLHPICQCNSALFCGSCRNCLADFDLNRDPKSVDVEDFQRRTKCTAVQCECFLWMSDDNGGLQEQSVHCFILASN